MKCIKKQGKHVMEYLRVGNDEAEHKVQHQGWEYTSKQEFKSKRSEFVKNEGTLVNAEDQDQKLVNYKSNFKAPKGTNSTKIGKGSNAARTGKYEKPKLTLKKIMKLPLKTFKEEGEKFDSVHIEHEVCKARKASMIRNFERKINPKNTDEK